MIRMVNSGTEATMSAIRVARGYTGRNKILKFEGCYHGHSDSLLVKSGSGLLTQGVPTSPGLVPALVEQTLVCPYNDEEALAEMIRANQDEIACVILEPIAGNMGVLAPHEGYLEAVRKLCTENGIVLIFDEVITGFRVDYHSAAGVLILIPIWFVSGRSSAAACRRRLRRQIGNHENGLPCGAGIPRGHPFRQSFGNACRHRHIKAFKIQS